MTDKEKEMTKRFEEFERNKPDKVVLPKAGLKGADLVFTKQFINGVPVYTADLDVPLWGIEE
jgi:hypothetical protein